MLSFEKRSRQKELLDQPSIPTEDLFRNLKELNTINTLLGGYEVIKKGLKTLLRKQESTIRILDIGSGGGDTLKYIHKKFGETHSLQLSGVDLKEDCIVYAKENCKNDPIHFIKSDYRDLIRKEEDKYDVVTASLFCHHLSNDELVDLIRWMYRNTKQGFVINDLHRHRFAYYSIKWLTSLFSKSYLVRNDAPLSVARSFERRDWELLFQKAAIKSYKIRWIWAFRWLVIVKH